MKLADLYWALIYPRFIGNGKEPERWVFEDPGAQTIMGMAPGALRLCIVEGAEARKPVAFVDLVAGRPIPVFYRHKSLALDGSDQIQTDAVVFGRTDREGNAALWAFLPDGHPRSCPPELIAAEVVQATVEAYGR